MEHRKNKYEMNEEQPVQPEHSVVGTVGIWKPN